MSSYADNIYVGFWVDYGGSTILGASITLPSLQGSVLISATTFYIVIVSGRLWSIICQCFHRTLASPAVGDGNDFHDGIHFQLLAVLRNSLGPFATAWKSLCLGWKWRKNADNAVKRGILFTALALFVAVASAAAGVFSSFLTLGSGSGTNVQAISKHCGGWNISNSFDKPDPWLPYTVNTTYTAREYALACYGSGSSSASCNGYVVPELPIIVGQTERCPLDNSTCTPDVVTPMTLDTGWIDSQFHLGINAPKEDRVAYRRFTTCVPITVHPWARATNETVLYPVPGSYVSVYIGNIYAYTVDNLTFTYNTHARLDGYSYQLQSVVSMAGLPGLWDPIPEFSRADGDVSIHFLTSNTVSYELPVSDPWFFANFSADDSAPYLSTYDVSALGCVDQFQFLNPATGASTDLTGQIPLSSSVLELDLNANQASTVTRIVLNDFENNMFKSVYGLGSGALLAQRSISGFINAATLPSNQWQIEVKMWFATALARLQYNIVDFASEIGPGPPNATFIPAAGSPLEGQCSNQMIRIQGGYLKFSFLGLMLTFILGLAIIILSFTLDAVVTCCGKIGTDIGNKYKDDQWAMDEVLHTSELLYKACGYTEWQNRSKTVPVTSSGLKLPSTVELEKLLSHNTAGTSRPGPASDEDGSSQGNPDQAVVEGPIPDSRSVADLVNGNHHDTTPLPQPDAAQNTGRRPVPSSSGTEPIELQELLPHGNGAVYGT